MLLNDEHKFIKVKLSDIETDMKSLESKFLDKALTLANDLSKLKKHCLENNIEYINGLRQENASLKAGNIALKARLDTTCFELSDLTTKVKDLENDKACLKTSLKILYKDYFQYQDCFQSNENGSNKQNSVASSSAVNSSPWLKPSSTCNFCKSADSNIEISNTFESLGCEGDTKESDEQ